MTIEWRKSSFCGSQACVDVARDGDDILLRDSKDGSMLRLNEAQWQEFAAGVSHEEFWNGSEESK